MKLELKIEKFNLRAFLEESEKNGKDIMTPTVQIIENLDDCWTDDIKVFPYEYLEEKLINDKNYLYVNFSSSGIEREINCINGESYYVIDEDDYEIEMEEEDSEFPEGTKPVKDLHLGETDSVGYLLKYENGILSIFSAIYYLYGKQFIGPCGMGSTTEIEIKEDVEILEQPMHEYLKCYVIE